MLTSLKPATATHTTYDLNTLAGKNDSVNNTPGLLIALSNFLQQEADTSDLATNPTLNTAISSSFVLTSPLDGRIVDPVGRTPIPPYPKAGATVVEIQTVKRISILEPRSRWTLTSRPSSSNTGNQDSSEQLPGNPDKDGEVEEDELETRCEYWANPC